MKKTLSTILLGASLVLGAGNKTKAQECQIYNHDNDEFSEEIICWKKEGFNEINLNTDDFKAILTIIYYSDKDNDNFHENIRIFNCSGIKHKRIYIDDFYIDKYTGLVNYGWKYYFISGNWWDKTYAKKHPAEIIKDPLTPTGLKIQQPGRARKKYYHLTKENLQQINLAERVKKLINAGAKGDQAEIKSLIEAEKRYIKNHHYQNPDILPSLYHLFE